MSALRKTSTVKQKSNCVQPRNRQIINKSNQNRTYKVKRNTLVGVLIAEVLWQNSAEPTNYSCSSVQPHKADAPAYKTQHKLPIHMPNQFLLITPHQPKTGQYRSEGIEMATLPQGAFAACKVREQYRERDYILSRMKTAGTDKNDLKNLTDNQPQLEYTPVKYNEKLMNSIWGLYNRYSPHNVKMNEYVPKKM